MIDRMRGVLAVAGLLFVWSSQVLAQAPPVINDVEILVNDSNTFVLDLETKGVLNPALGPYLITAVSVLNQGVGANVTLENGPVGTGGVSFTNGRGGDKCVAMTFDNVDNMVATNISVSVTGVGGSNTGTFRVRQGGSDYDNASTCISPGQVPTNVTIGGQNPSPARVRQIDGPGATVSVSFTTPATDVNGISAYNWTVNGQAAAGNATLTTALPVGTHNIGLSVLDRDGTIFSPPRNINTASANTASVNVALDNRPVANVANSQIHVQVQAGAQGNFSLDATPSTDDLPGLQYVWSDVTDSESPQQVGTGQVLQLSRPEGEYTFQLQVTDSAGQTSADPPTVAVTISQQSAGNTIPQINSVSYAPNPAQGASGAATIQVTLQAQATDAQSDPILYNWVRTSDETSVGTLQNQPVTLNVPAQGSTTYSFRLEVRDTAGGAANTAGLDVVVQAGALANLVANAGADQTGVQAAADGRADVTLNGNQSTPAQLITSYAWTWLDAGEQESATGVSPSIRLPIGQTTVTLTVTDSNSRTATDTVLIGVIEAPTRGLSSITGLTPNQASIATYIDQLCPALGDNIEDLNEDQADLLERCSGLKSPGTTDGQAAAGLTAMAGEEIAAQQTTALDFSSMQLGNVAARMVALRQGASGISVADLNLSYEGQTVPLGILGDFVREVVMGGASGDADGALDSRLGVFLNGRYGWGDKDATANEAGFDFDSMGLTLGADYRFTSNLVLGVAAGYSTSETEFDADSGNLDSDGLSGSLFGTYYRGRFYADSVVSFGQVDYDSVRRILYSDTSGTIDTQANGKSDGDLTSFGVSFGYELGSKAWSFIPTLSASYIKVKVDAFAETGGNGLALAFDEQEAKSFTVQGGGRLGYTKSFRWGVLRPEARVSFVREMENDSQVLNVRFVNDPFVGTPQDPSSGATIVTDAPDESYMRWGTSLSAVFQRGVSAFVDYESVAGFDTVSANELTIGVRFQRIF